MQALVAGGREEAASSHARRHQHATCTASRISSFLRHDNTLARPYTSWGRDERVDIVLTNPPFGGKEEDGIESNFPPHFRTRETADLFLALIIPATQARRPGRRGPA